MKIEDLHSRHFIVFSGGAIRGIALCGAFNTLCDLYFQVFKENYIEQIKGAAGTSIGAAIALAVVCGVCSEQIKNICFEEKIWNSLSMSSNHALRFVRNGGCFMKASVLYEKIDHILNFVGLDKDLTFEQLFKKTGKIFVCNASCLDDHSILYMSHNTTPNLKIRDGLYMTMALPSIFPCLYYMGKEYHDGGVLLNYIIHCFPVHQTIGITLDNRKPIERVAPCCGSFSKIKHNIISICSYIERLNLANLNCEQLAITIFISTPGFTVIKLNVTPEEIKCLWEYGKSAASWFLMKKDFIKKAIEEAGQFEEPIEEINLIEFYETSIVSNK